MLRYSRISSGPSETDFAAARVVNELRERSISLFIALLQTKPDTGSTQIATISAPTALKPEETLLAKSKRAVAAASPPSLVSSTSRLIERFRKRSREMSSPECWKPSIPGILYVIQNNMQFVAASNLQVATFPVTNEDPHYSRVQRIGAEEEVEHRQVAVSAGIGDRSWCRGDPNGSCGTRW